MQTIESTEYLISRRNVGGRVASDALRASRQLCEDFTGLEEGADRYGLLLLVKRVGTLGGFTPRMIQLLDYYIAYTSETDWQAGSRPIVFQSVSRTALDLGVSERQIQKLEAALFDAGAITWNDSGNHKRYGRRCPDTNRIVFAYGVDLTPLAYLRPELEAELDTKRQHDEAWMAAKREVSSLRREFRGLVSEWAERGEQAPCPILVARYDEIAIQIRTHIALDRLEKLLAAHRTLVKDLRDAMGLGSGEAVQGAERAVMLEEAAKRSCRSDATFAHYNYTTQPIKISCSQDGEALQESVADRPEPTDIGQSPGRASAMEHVTLGMALGAASERFSAYLPNEPGWHDLVEAAYAVGRDLGVSQASWAEACRLLGRNGAAVALLVTDRASTREVDPVRTPPAYFRGMVRRAESGELRLCRSLFGLLKRGRSPEACAA